MVDKKFKLIVTVKHDVSQEDITEEEMMTIALNMEMAQNAKARRIHVEYVPIED